MAKKGGLPGNLKLTRDGVDALRRAMRAMASQQVLVGFPDDGKARTIEPGEQDITNAALGRVHDKGDSEARIPPRPFMRPGMDDAKPLVIAALAKTARRLFKTPTRLVVEQGLTEAGIKAQVAIKKRINSGVPPPLADSTLQKRAAKGRKGAAKELENRAQGLPPSTQLAKPLIDTGQMRNAVNYVIRRKK